MTKLSEGTTPTEKGSPNLAKIIRAGGKKYGAGSFLKASSAPRDFKRIPTGIFPLDVCFAGGFPIHSVSSIWGSWGCLSQDTEILINRGKRGGGRVYTIENLFLKFHGLNVKGKGNYQKWDRNSPSRVPSLKEDGFIGYHNIHDVIYSGKQETYIVRTHDGLEIRVTETHPFKVPNNIKGADQDGFIELKDLSVGDTILCQRNIPYGTDCSYRPSRKSVSGIKYHPYAWKKIVSETDYKRLVYSRLVVEADMNNMDIDTFISILKTEEDISKRLKFLPIDLQIHHIDEDLTNNDLDNLEILTCIEHSRLHWKPTMFPNRNTMEKEIESIEYYGIENTYDIIMEDPYRNFVANGFIVHNSAKTYIAQKTIVQATYLCHRCYEYEWDCQCKEGPKKMKSLLLDCEGSFDWGWAEDLGISDDLDVIYGLTGEEYVDIYHSALRADDVGFIVIDSIAALTPNAEMAGSAEDNYVMTQARLVSYMVRKGKTLLMKERKAGHNVTVLMLNQVRAKPASFGPTEEAPGGNASKHDFTLSARAGKRSVTKKDSDDMPEHTTISISLGSSMSKKKCLVLAGSCQFNVSLSSASAFTRGTVLDHDSVLAYALEEGFVQETDTKNSYMFNNTLYVKADLLSLFQGNDQVYYSLQKRIIEEKKRKALSKP